MLKLHCQGGFAKAYTYPFDPRAVSKEKLLSAPLFVNSQNNRTLLLHDRIQMILFIGINVLKYAVLLIVHHLVSIYLLMVSDTFIELKILSVVLQPSTHYDKASVAAVSFQLVSASTMDYSCETHQGK